MSFGGGVPESVPGVALTPLYTNRPRPNMIVTSPADLVFLP